MAKKTKSQLRSEAAKKGWRTRRKNRKTLEELGVDYSEEYEIKRAILAEHWRVKTLIMKAAFRSISVATALELIPKELHVESIKSIIQHRMDSAVKIFGDPRIEAWDLAEELGWDISDVYDAWDYDENAA